jgi:hypothetical protein
LFAAVPTMFAADAAVASTVARATATAATAKRDPTFISSSFLARPAFRAGSLTAGRAFMSPPASTAPVTRRERGKAAARAENRNGTRLHWPPRGAFV